MGERQEFQPLTKEDRITVMLYRSGIVASTIILCGMAVLAATASSPSATIAGDILLYGLYVSTGLSVFFIHLYIGRFKRYLKNLYFIGIGCLIVLLIMGKGALSGAITGTPYGPLLLLPLSGCLGFVTAKEAFCFQLIEGYLLAMIMPLYLLLVAGGALSGRGASYGLALIAALHVIFTLRKAFMPLAYDIGDKSAYQP